MAKKNPAVDAYIAQAAPFARPILKHLRQIVHTACPEVEESIKWSRPHFGYQGNLAGMAAFKAHCSFGFWKGALVVGRDAEAREDAMGHFGRITQLSDLPNDKTLLGFVRKAVELNESGVKAPRAAKPKQARVLEVPDDLAAALSKQSKARQAFANFSASHRNEYVEWITEAKRPETRAKRLASTIAWLAEGKSRNWKYQTRH